MHINKQRVISFMIVLLIIEDLQSVVRVTCMTVTDEVYTSIFMLI